MPTPLRFVVFLFLAGLAGCTTFRSTTIERARRMPQSSGELLITTTDERRLRVHLASITPDSIVGINRDDGSAVRLHHGQVRQLQARQLDTGMVGFLLIVAVLVGVPIIALSSM